MGAGRCAMLGCLGLFLGGLMLILCAGFGTYYIISKQVEKYTSTTPDEIPTVQYTPEQMVELKSRIAQFRELLEADPSSGDPSDVDDQGRSQSVETADTDVAENPAASVDPTKQAVDSSGGAAIRELVLSADDINAMIAGEESLRGRLFVRIEEGKISGDISIPIESFVPGSKGRYLNGSGTFDVKLDDGVLMVLLEDAKVKGESLPEELLKAMRTENLAKDVYKDPKNAEMIRRFESIRVEDDRVIARIRQLPSQQPDRTRDSNPTR